MVSGGKSAAGESLTICRISVGEGGKIPGKYVASLRACLVAWGGSEKYSYNMDLLKYKNYT
jgi:hypothetical protein